MLTIDPTNIENAKSLLEKQGVAYGIIGKFSGSNIVFKDSNKSVISVRVDKAQERWLNSLGSLVSHG